MISRVPISSLFPYTTLFRSAFASGQLNLSVPPLARRLQVTATPRDKALEPGGETSVSVEVKDAAGRAVEGRSEEHTSELQSQSNLVCRLLLEKKKQISLQLN